MMGEAKSATRTLASIRQLCCLDLPEELLIPKFLDGLRDWLPSHNSHFYWADPKTLQPVNYYGDGFGKLDTVRRFITHTSQMDHPGLAVAFPEVMRHHTSGTFGCDGPDAPLYLKSDMYGEVMKPFDGRYVLYLVVRNIHGQPRGLLSMLRHPSDKAFSKSDHQKLLQLEPYLRHAFSAAPQQGRAAESRDSQGMAVLSRGGALLFQDDQARRLLYLASQERLGAAGLFHLDAHGLTPELRRLQQRLVGIFDERAASPPVFECSNRWGRFVFRGSWLEGSGERAVGVTVTHHIPRTLRAWQGLHGLDLAPRQQQVALLYSEGKTLADISAELNISRNTVSDHVDVIYKRLDITPSREALQQALLN
ncbi:MAG: helix-turn-helix transcriptional regulator [Polaromonas sp.]|nr:helix-turn-helix transcriptional regulator [Polaromonas sp.]